jgi:hypothetical protein
MGILVTSALVVFWLVRRNAPPRGLLVLMAAAAGICLVFNPLAALVQRPSIKAFAEFLKPRLAPDTAVFSLRDYYQDLPPYLGRVVGVVNYIPDEQEFGLSLEAHSERYLNAPDFIELWQGKKRVFALTTARSSQKFTEQNPGWQPFVVMQDENFVLLSNRPEP